MGMGVILEVDTEMGAETIECLAGIVIVVIVLHVVDCITNTETELVIDLDTTL